MSLGQKALFGVAWSTAGKFAGFALTFAGQLLLVRLLPVRDFGTFALALSFFQVFTVFVDGNFPSATVQMQDEPDLLDTAFVLCASQGAVIFILSAALSYGVWLRDPLNQTLPFLLLLLGARYALAPVVELYDAQLQKHFLFQRLTLVGFLSSTLTTGVAVLLAKEGLGVWSLFIREFCAIVGNLIGYRIASGVRFRWKFKKDAAVKLFAFGKKMLVSSSLAAIFNRMDNFLIAYFLGVDNVGFYSQARYLADLVQSGISPVNVVTFPLYAKLKKQPEKLRHGYQVVTFFLVRLILPFSIVFALFPGDTASFLFGEKWRPAGEALRGLALYPLLSVLLANLDSFLIGVGKIAVTAWARGVQILSAVGLISLGAYFFGLGGAALAVTGAYLIGLLALGAWGERQPLSDLWKSLWAPSTAAALSFACILLFKKNGPVHLPIGTLSEFILSAVALYALLLLAMEYKTAKANVRFILSRLKPKTCKTIPFFDII